MSCHTGKITKKQVAILSVLGAIAAGIGYISITTNNPALSAAVPAILAFALCPIMFAAMGGVVWFVSCFKKNNGPVLSQKDSIPSN